MPNCEQLIAELEQSDVYFIEEEEGWTAKSDGVDVRVEARDERIVRVIGRTGIAFVEEKMSELLATMAHMSGWKYKVGEFDIAPDNEIVVYLDREVGSEPVERMVTRMARSARDSSTILRKVVQGVPIQDAVSDEDASIARMLRDALD